MEVKKDQKSPEEEELIGIPDPDVEPLSKEFYAQFAPRRDPETWKLLHKLGCIIKDDGSCKMIRAMFKAALEESFIAWHEGLIDIDQFREYIDGLATGKVTRYKLEVELAKLRREAKKAETEG